MNYKTIIFDLGGVVLNINLKLTEQAFVSLGLSNFANLYSFEQQQQLFNDLETGRITAAAFIASLRKLLPAGISDEQIITAWNALLLDLPVERLQLLTRLRNKHQLILLSNTNSIHLDAINTYLKKTYKVDGLEAYFDKTYYSFKEGIRKPDKAIFERVLEENNLVAEATLFIDDSPQHIATAKQLGIATVWLQPPTGILDVFSGK